MSAVNSRNGSPKAPAKPKHSSQLREFLALGKKIFQDKEVSDYDQLLDNKKELEQKLLLKNQEFNAKVEELSALRSSTAEVISNLESENKTLFERFEKRVISWDTGKTKQTDLENKVVKLQQKLTETNERAESSTAAMESLQNKLFEHQNASVETKNTLMAIKKELNSKERELKGTVKELESTQAELDEQRTELGFEDPSGEHL